MAFILILLNVAVFAAQLVVPLLWGGFRLEPYLALSAADLGGGQVWQLLSFQFLHSGLLHLIVNCAMLYLFGTVVESELGRASFLRMYLGSGVVGGLVQVAGSGLFPGHFGRGAVLGASAGVFALIAAFAALNWERPITTLVAFILPVTMRAKYLVLVETVIAVLGLLGADRSIAHGAHLGGIVGGLVYVQVFVRLRFRLAGTWQRLIKPRLKRELVGSTAQKRGGRGRAAGGAPDDLPPADFISREVDPILDKINAQGIQSLTERERRILEAARRRINKH